MVDLHNITEGDVVCCDDGSEHVVDSVTFDVPFVILHFCDFGGFEFNYDGTKFQEDEEVGNIIRVLHKEQCATNQTEGKTVDLNALNVGAKVKFRNGKSSIVNDVILLENEVFPFKLYLSEEYGVCSYKRNGAFFNDASSGRDIVEIIKKPGEFNGRPVKHPSFNEEDKETIKVSMTHEEYKSFLKGNVLIHLLGYEHKGNPVEDLEKAWAYLERLIREEKGGNI